MYEKEYQEILSLLENSVTIEDDQVKINDKSVLRVNIGKLAELSAIGSGSKQGIARYMVRLIAQEFGAIPASINDLYFGRGEEKIPHTFTVPAMNLRMLSYDAAKAVFRVANEINAGAFIFEIARSEMGYTDQRPAEFVTSILAAAVSEGYQGPIFIQGDHFQVSASRYANDPEAELKAVKDLSQEAIDAGYFNIDIDTSTLVDINLPTVVEQQVINSSLSAHLTAYIRSIEPEGVTISIGGEIGEVGGHNSTKEELEAYMDGFNSELEKLAPGSAGLSKISIQTGTSHGGVVLPDGSIQKVAVDFDTLLNLSRLSRDKYNAGGAVQHGASTLPEDAFDKFVDSEALEVHLATGFQNIAFDLLPDEIRTKMYSYLDTNNASDRKSGMTDDQFYYKTRKYAIGPYKKDLWQMSDRQRATVSLAWEKTFRKLFNLLGIDGTMKYVNEFVKPKIVQPEINTYLNTAKIEEDVSDLAD